MIFASTTHHEGLRRRGPRGTRVDYKSRYVYRETKASRYTCKLRIRKVYTYAARVSPCDTRVRLRTCKFTRDRDGLSTTHRDRRWIRRRQTLTAKGCRQSLLTTYSSTTGERSRRICPAARRSSSSRGPIRPVSIVNAVVRVLTEISKFIFSKILNFFLKLFLRGPTRYPCNRRFATKFNLKFIVKFYKNLKIRQGNRILNHALRDF